MMAAAFGVLLLAGLLEFFDRRRRAGACLAVALGLGLGLFLWEIYSPDYGFRMPWLQVEVLRAPSPVLGG